MCYGWPEDKSAIKKNLDIDRLQTGDCKFADNNLPNVFDPFSVEKAGLPKESLLYGKAIEARQEPISRAWTNK